MGVYVYGAPDPRHLKATFGVKVKVPKVCAPVFSTAAVLVWVLGVCRRIIRIRARVRVKVTSKLPVPRPSFHDWSTHMINVRVQSPCMSYWNPLEPGLGFKTHVQSQLR